MPLDPPLPGAEATIGARIRALRVLLSLPQKDFARHLAVSQSTLSQIENGYYAPSYGSIARLVDEVPVDCNWLLRGEGDPLHEDHKDVLVTPSSANVRIAAVTVEALASYPSDHQNETWLSEQPSYLIPGYDRPGDFRVFQVEGESMEPTIFNQDFLVCERLRSSLDAFIGRPLLVVTASEVLCKRVSNYTMGSQSLLLSSDNPRYETLELALSEVQELWHTVGRLTRHLSGDFARHDRRLNHLEAAVQELKASLRGS